MTDDNTAVGNLDNGNMLFIKVGVTVHSVLGNKLLFQYFVYKKCVDIVIFP